MQILMQMPRMTAENDVQRALESNMLTSQRFIESSPNMIIPRNMRTIFVTVVFLLWLGIAHGVDLSVESSLSLLNATNIPYSEMDALYDLYMTTNGPEWKWAPPVTEIGNLTHTNGVPWNFTEGANPCTDRWQGLNCTLSPDNTNYHIAEIVLVRHNLQGTLPPSIGNFSMLHYLNLDTNGLHGTLPESLTELSRLVVLSFSANNFTGPIPKVYQELVLLRRIFLNDNKLSGKIPNIFSGLEHLAELGLDNNHFSGPIPTSFGNLPDLQILYLDANIFTGTVPSALCSLPHLRQVRLSYNYLHGPLPPCITNMTALTMFEVQDNAFTGTIPADIGNLHNMQYFYLSNNDFTGSIPASVGEIHGLLDINLRSNRLTGRIPDSFGGLTSLSNLYLYYNYLTGPLPASMNLMHRLNFMYIHDNFLSGALPVLSNWTAVTSVFLNNNQFSGPLEGVFSSITQGKITTIQLSNNQFTGTLPPDIFRIANLTTFAAVSNCFTGSLPLTICSSPSIGTLVLDGLHSASSCRDTILPGLSDGYILESKISGGIPSCLLSIHSLTTLHLSGNGLSGQLPDNVDIGARLLDFSVSHNELTGTIPSEFQSKDWYNLDLSYNRFSGSLQLNFGYEEINKTLYYNTTLTDANVCLALRNNRLSGNIPHRIFHIQNISVLDGNLFTCNLPQTDLPSHDDGRNTYQCGSNSFNISYYIWLAMLGAVVVAAVVVFWFRYELKDYLALDKAAAYYDKWMHHIEFVPERDSAYNRDMGMKNYKYTMYVCEGVCKVGAMCTIYILGILIPIYASMSKTYGTHKFEYAWTVSAAFLSGTAAAALLLVAFVVLMVFAFVLFTIHIRRYVREKEEFFYTAPEEVRRPSRMISEAVSRDSNARDSNARESQNRDSRADSVATPLVQDKTPTSMIMKANVYIVFFLINFAVVMGVNVIYVYVRLYQSSRLLVIAQLALSVFKIIWNSFCSVYIIRWVDNYLTEASTDDWKSKESGFFAIQLFVALFNYIAIPCLVVAVISPDCYNNLVIQSSAVDSHFLFNECEVFNNAHGCLRSLPKVASTTYNPPFTYSYECSSSLITFYAPTYVYLCFIVTFVNPVFEYAAQVAQSTATRGTWYSGQLDYWVPLILQTVSQETEATKLPYDLFNPYLDANLLLVSIITYLGVLLTFGAVFPPLAACLLVTMLSTTFNTKLLVGRFLTNALDANLHKYGDIIEAECQGAGSIPKLRQCVRLLLVFCFCFYTPFLFDTLGDAVGLQRSYWVIFILPLIAVFGIGTKFALKKLFPEFLRAPDDHRRSHSRHQRDVEMSAIPALPALAAPTVLTGTASAGPFAAPVIGNVNYAPQEVEARVPHKIVPLSVQQQHNHQHQHRAHSGSEEFLVSAHGTNSADAQQKLSTDSAGEDGGTEPTFNILQGQV